MQTLWPQQAFLYINLFDINSASIHWASYKLETPALSSVKMPSFSLMLQRWIWNHHHFWSLINSPVKKYFMMILRVIMAVFSKCHALETPSRIFTHSVFCSLNKCLLSTYYVASMVPGAGGNKATKKRVSDPTPQGPDINSGRDRKDIRREINGKRKIKLESRWEGSGRLPF